MALTSIKLRPGLDSVKTPTLNEGGWSSGQAIRFFEGLPQKDGGFAQFCQMPGGVPHALRAWTALSGVSYLAVGAQLRLSVFEAEFVTDITPLTVSVSIPIDISATAGSQTFTVFTAVVTPAPGDWFIFEAPVSVAGVVLFGAYGVTASAAGQFSFVAAQAAEETVAHTGQGRQFDATMGSPVIAVSLPEHGLTNGQATQILVPVLVGGLTLAGGYRITFVDSDNYTVTSPIPAPSTGTENGRGHMTLLFMTLGGGAQNDFPAAQYSLANWGEFLMACPQNGTVYVWMPANGTATPAQRIPTAPKSNTFIFVAIQAQQLVCCGSVDPATTLFDPMLLRWSDTGDYTDFTASPTNAAGSFRLAIGSRIVAGIAITGQNLIWTDLALYSMQYVVGPLIWGFQPLGLNCGAVSVNSVGIIGGQIAWMSQNQFYVLGPEGPKPLPCPVWDQVFPNADRANFDLVTCETNSYFNEIGWSVPQLDGTTVFARVQLDTGAWTASPYHHHTAWIDQSPFGAPIGAHEDGTIDQHEVGNDAYGQALLPTATTGMIMIAEGEEAVFVREVVPDIKFGPSGGTVEMTGYFYDEPNKAPRVKGPVLLTPISTTAPGMRGRARQVQFSFASTDIGTFWRLGNMRYRGQPDGKR